MILPDKHIAIVILILASCSDSSNLDGQTSGRSGAPATRLVEQAKWGQLDPLYTFVCSAYLDSEAGNFVFEWTYLPNGNLDRVHAIWHSPTNAKPRIQAVFNTDHGRDFDIGAGFVTLTWQFIPQLRPGKATSRLIVGDLPFAPDPRTSHVPGMAASVFGNNSVAMTSVRWRDLVRATQDGSIPVRVEVTDATKGWKNHLYPGYLAGLRIVGDNALESSISNTTITSAKRQLEQLAANTSVTRPSDVPRRCVKSDSVAIID